jgi:hypothetical protein
LHFLLDPGTINVEVEARTEGEIEMYKITFDGRVINVEFATEQDAWFGVYEALDEAFGRNFGAEDVARYSVIKV